MTWSFVQSGEVYILVNNYSLNLICKKKNPVLIVIYLDLFLLDIDDKHTTMKSEI